MKEKGRLQSAIMLTMALNGLEAQPVHLEVDVDASLSGFEVYGLSEASARESRIRVRSALEGMGVNLMAHKIMVRVEPINVLQKSGAFDVAMAMAVLAALDHVPRDALGSTLFLGELSLRGALRPARGILPMLLGAAQLGYTQAIIPRGNAAEAAAVRGMKVVVAEHLGEVVEHFKGENKLEELGEAPAFAPMLAPGGPDLAEVAGNHVARRALEIAAAGGHNLLLVGTPGSGKTMLARRLGTILPPLTLDEALEVSSIHSVAGLSSAEQGLLSSRPFRAPHHTVSAAGLVGGGFPARPGEVSLAHRGVLFLDELFEFRRGVIEALRHALVNGAAIISRGDIRITFPARPLVVAAVNPCSCGYAGDPTRQCVCTPERLRRYRAQLSEALYDWFDLRVALAPVNIGHLQRQKGESSATVRERVERARAVQAERANRGEVRSRLNAKLVSSELERVAQPDAAGMKVISNDIQRMGLTAPFYERVLRVARTIADLERSGAVRATHIAEALQVSLFGYGADSSPLS